MHLRQPFWLRLLGTAMILALAGACTGPAAPTEVMDDMEHADETQAGHEHDADAEHSDDHIPNDGAVVHILSPADGATITGNEVEVKIETTNFAFGEAGRHWHVYLDGNEVAMVAGGDASYVPRGLTPGEHEIEVTLSNDEHQELEDGATIHITIVG